ncbi:MAG TPA: mechanosensitive ion channel domain-containing protein [Allosphingosinicella sp.]|uniref:mechanosensitive ion channel family protein n=1 Tax=Allosphingosinicella sp. TaxID=2823234 RepID=UPI002ED834B3
MNLSEKTAALAEETTHWLSANAVDILIAAAVGVGIALILLAIRSLGCKVLRRGAAPSKFRTILARMLSKTTLFFIVMAAAMLVADNAETPPRLMRLIEILFVVAASFQAAIWARELVIGFIEHRVGPGEEQSTLGSAIGIIRLLVTVALFAIAIILILSNLGVNVTGLVAGLGIGGIAIGLAAQGIFSDLFAALAIILDRPFRRGDTITFGSPPATGTVEQIGLKTTRVRALSGEEVVISNTKLLEQQLQNWTELRRRRALMTFGIVYQTRPELVARIPMEMKEIVEAQPLATFDRCHAFQFAPSSIDFELIFFVESADMVDFMATRQAVMLGMLTRFAELEVSFAYPTQTTFTAAPDGTLVMPYATHIHADAGGSQADIVQR